MFQVSKNVFANSYKNIHMNRKVFARFCLGGLVL